MSYIFKKGATSQSIEVYIIDSTDGTPETGVLFNTAGIDLKYRRKDAAVVSITEADLTSPALTDTWETGGFLEIGNGVYRLDLPDAALASAAGIDRVVVFGTVTGMVVLPVNIHLTDMDLNDAVRAGLTALPNAAAEAAGGLFTRGSGAGQINQNANGEIDADAIKISRDATAANNLELQYDGTGIIGDNFPATQAEIAAVGGGLAIKTTLTSVTVVLGSQQDLSNLNASDGTNYWTGDDDGSGAEFIFLCTPGQADSVPGELLFEGYYDEPAGADNSATLQVYNFNSASWDTEAVLTNNSKNEDHEAPLSHANRAPGSGTLEGVAYTIGDVLIKFKQDAQETGNACLKIDYMRIGFIGSLVTATEIIDEFETQSQADPTGFHVNVKEVNGTGQTANDGQADINTILTRVTGNVALASVVGALNNAAAAGEVTSADTLMQYLKQLINILIGTPGIVTFPAGSAPANAVSLAEVIRDIQEDTTAIQAKLPTNKFMGSSDGADDDGTLNAIKVITDLQRSVSGTVVVNNPGTDTIFDLTAVIGTLSTTNDSPNNMQITIFDISGDVKETRKVTDFVGASGRVTLDAALTFPVDDGVDTFILWNRYSPTAAAGGGATAQEVHEYDVSGITTDGLAGHEIQQSGGSSIYQ